MAENKSSLSKEDSYQKISEFWDANDLSNVWEKTEAAEFEVDLESDVFYYAVETSLSKKLRSIAEKKGLSTESLVNLWLREKVNSSAVADD
ncbi:MAG TPA: CopG family antitoxin [Pyrinomonadaceae bacterium]|nr:CopG family antitoxin [Pyrinomonadaceae bacterium]